MLYFSRRVKISRFYTERLDSLIPLTAPSASPPRSSPPSLYSLSSLPRFDPLSPPQHHQILVLNCDNNALTQPDISEHRALTGPNSFSITVYPPRVRLIWYMWLGCMAAYWYNCCERLHFLSNLTNVAHENSHHKCIKSTPQEISPVPELQVA